MKLDEILDGNYNHIFIYNDKLFIETFHDSKTDIPTFIPLSKEKIS